MEQFSTHLLYMYAAIEADGGAFNDLRSPIKHIFTLQCLIAKAELVDTTTLIAYTCPCMHMYMCTWMWFTSQSHHNLWILGYKRA